MDSILILDHFSETSTHYVSCDEVDLDRHELWFDRFWENVLPPHAWNPNWDLEAKCDWDFRGVQALLEGTKISNVTSFQCAWYAIKASTDVLILFDVKFMLEMLTSMIQPAIAAIRCSSLKIFQFGDESDFPLSLLIASNVFSPLCTLVESLNCLQISVQVDENLQASPLVMAHIFGKAQYLTELSIGVALRRFDSGAESEQSRRRDWVTMFSDCSWQHLKTLGLEFLSFDPDVLERLTCNAKRTLRSLKFHSVELLGKDDRSRWSTFGNRIGQCLQLHHLRLCGIDGKNGPRTSDDEQSVGRQIMQWVPEGMLKMAVDSDRYDGLDFWYQPKS